MNAQELVERLNIFASDGCVGIYDDEPCFRARPGMPMEWCPRCAAQEAAKLIAAEARGRQQAEQDWLKRLVATEDHLTEVAHGLRRQVEQAEQRVAALTQALKDTRDSGLLSGCISLGSDNGLAVEPDCQCDGCKLNRQIDAALTGAQA